MTVGRAGPAPRRAFGNAEGRLERYLAEGR
jgi:hypothetical protein